MYFLPGIRPGRKWLKFYSLHKQRTLRDLFDSLKCPPENSGGRFLWILAADDGQHFAVGLHSLGQVLHHLHIVVPPKGKCDGLFSYRVPMQAAISPMFCIALIMFFFINNTSKIECELFFSVAGSGASLNQAWRYYSIRKAIPKGAILTSDRKILTYMKVFFPEFVQNTDILWTFHVRIFCPLYWTSAPISLRKESKEDAIWFWNG